MVLGNHDLFNKNSTDVNSINIFRDNSHIHVIDKPIELQLNGKAILFVPWLSNLSSFKANSYDFLFGHFDISSKFLISNYIQEHSRAKEASNDVANEIDKDSYLDEAVKTSSKPEDFLGSFIELAKTNGTIFAGHIHQHKEMVVKGRNFIFVGSPYEQTLGDIGCKCGFYEIDELGNYSFFEIEGIPKHIQFKSSEILRVGINNFDFSKAKGNIVQKVYDIDISMEDDLKVNQKIASFKPYEELLPDYQVALDLTKEDIEHQDGLVKMLKKSKLDYIESYINQLEDIALSSAKIDKNALFKLMASYYRKAVGEE